LRNRANGLAAETRHLLLQEQVPDEVLVQRIRSQIGLAAASAGSIEVTANNGRVMLAGPILAGEFDDLLRRVTRVRGVQDVDNRLEIYRDPGDIPGLQADRQRWAEQRARAAENWAPGTRLLFFSGGVILLLYGLIRRGVLGQAGSLIGLGLATRSLTNRPLQKLFGLAGEGEIYLQKTIQIDAPVEEVFAFWRNFENFPGFMAHVKEVRDLGDGRSYWAVQGPAGVPLSWEAQITRLEPNRAIEWRSEPGAAIQQAGAVHFSPGVQGGTQLDVKLSYSPPAGAIGHAIASFFGDNPRQQMNEELARLKSLLEQGKTTVAGKQARYYAVSGSVEEESDETRQEGRMMDEKRRGRD
jgi:uncharacterized membrane protein